MKKFIDTWRYSFLVAVGLACGLLWNVNFGHLYATIVSMIGLGIHLCTLDDKSRKGTSITGYISDLNIYPSKIIPNIEEFEMKVVGRTSKGMVANLRVDWAHKREISIIGWEGDRPKFGLKALIQRG